MAANIGDSSGPAAPPEPDSSENAPLLQGQGDQNENMGPPPPFVASKWIYNHYKLFFILSKRKLLKVQPQPVCFRTYYEICSV